MVIAVAPLLPLTTQDLWHPAESSPPPLPRPYDSGSFQQVVRMCSHTSLLQPLVDAACS